MKPDKKNPALTDPLTKAGILPNAVQDYTCHVFCHEQRTIRLTRYLLNEGFQVKTVEECLGQTDFTKILSHFLFSNYQIDILPSTCQEQGYAETLAEAACELCSFKIFQKDQQFVFLDGDSLEFQLFPINCQLYANLTLQRGLDEQEKPEHDNHFYDLFFSLDLLGQEP